MPIYPNEWGVCECAVAICHGGTCRGAANSPSPWPSPSRDEGSICHAGIGGKAAGGPQSRKERTGTGPVPTGDGDGGVEVDGLCVW